MNKTLIILFVIGLILAAISQILPEEKVCGDRDYTVINGVLFCKCSDNEYQKPGKCEDKYK